MMETVCKQNCPERSATCHATCKRYLAEYEEKRERYDKLTKEVMTNYAIDDITKYSRMKEK